MKPLVTCLDDSATIREALGGALESLGEVRCSGYWSEIATWILQESEGRPVALVCDLVMPGIDGLEFCHIVRRHRPTVAIVLFTGRPDAVKGDEFLVVGKSEGYERLAQAVQGALLQQQTLRP